MTKHVRTMEYQCPWCGHEGRPLYTAQHPDLAEFVHSPKNAASIARNPLMCDECHGVGGLEDFLK